MAISIILFVRRKLRDHFSDVRKSSVATGQARLMALPHVAAPCAGPGRSQCMSSSLAMQA